MKIPLFQLFIGMSIALVFSNDNGEEFKASNCTIHVKSKTMSTRTFVELMESSEPATESAGDFIIKIIYDNGDPDLMFSLDAEGIKKHYEKKKGSLASLKGADKYGKLIMDIIKELKIVRVESIKPNRTSKYQ